MSYTIAQKIIASHLRSGSMEVGSEIGLKIDQTLTQDATGTMAYLQFEALGIDRVKTELSVAYIDHNTLQSGFENADDHEYIRSVAKKHGLYFSRPGNGIAIRYISNDSASRARRSSALTAIHLPQAVSVCWHSVRVVSMLLSPWAAASIT